MAAVELDGLLLSAALAAARRLAPGSLIGLLEHLLPDGDRVRALRLISAYSSAPTKSVFSAKAKPYS